MKWLENIFEKQKPLFEKGGKFHRFLPLFEAQYTILFTPGHVTRGNVHVRDGLDLKRLMFTVVVALQPAFLMAAFNTGYQAHLAIEAGAQPLDSWQTQAYQLIFGLFSDGNAFTSANLLGCLLHGAIYFTAVYAITMAVGGLWEVIFAVVRGHDVTEGFLVTGALIPLTLPATIPLWQVAVGATFGIVLAKEIFGGVGMNFLNPALAVRAFLFFAYPAEISGDKVWVAASNLDKVDGVSGATWLARFAESGPAVFSGTDTLPGVEWWEAFVGLIPGSMGETSTLACLLGAVILLLTGVGSWRTMFGVTVGTVLMAALLNAIGSDTNAMFALSPAWHMVLGGWAFGMVFMATDPVSSAFTDIGKLVYGLFIGLMVVLIRVVNPAYPEGMMLAILFMNMFAPLIDHYVKQANIKRREARYAV